MPRLTRRDLLARGVSPADIDAAEAHRRRQRDLGQPVTPLAQAVGYTDPPAEIRAGTVAGNLLERQRRSQRRSLGSYSEAALLAQRQALLERDPARAADARSAAGVLRSLANEVQQEFDFFGGTVTLAHQYQDAVTARLFRTARTGAQAKEALAILWTITRHLGFQTYECTATASRLCELTKTKKQNMAVALKLLEEVGAIRRVRRGRVKVITVTPEGAYRGRIEDHGKAVEKYRLEVIEGGRDNDNE